MYLTAYLLTKKPLVCCILSETMPESTNIIVLLVKLRLNFFNFFLFKYEPCTALAIDCHPIPDTINTRHLNQRHWNYSHFFDWNVWIMFRKQHNYMRIDLDKLLNNPWHFLRPKGTKSNLICIFPGRNNVCLAVEWVEFMNIQHVLYFLLYTF